MDDQQLLQYSRHLLLPDIDIEGQERLLAASALIVGLGGLGSPAAMYLASSGIGRLVLNDFDTVDPSNLQRQILYGWNDIGHLKTHSAAKMLRSLNKGMTIELRPEQLEEASLSAVVEGVDIVLDCSDNLATRHRINRACFRHKKPLVSGAVIRFEGQFCVFRPGIGESPCYNCLYEESEELEDSCSRSGVIAPLPGIIGSLQALETVKMLTMKDYAIPDTLFLLDAKTLDIQRLKLKRNPGCLICGVDVQNPL